MVGNASGLAIQAKTVRMPTERNARASRRAAGRRRRRRSAPAPSTHRPAVRSSLRSSSRTSAPPVKTTTCRIMPRCSRAQPSASVATPLTRSSVDDAVARPAAGCPRHRPADADPVERAPRVEPPPRLCRTADRGDRSSAGMPAIVGERRSPVVIPSFAAGAPGRHRRDDGSRAAWPRTSGGRAIKGRREAGSDVRSAPVPAGHR